jgi:hypothetical protein
MKITKLHVSVRSLLIAIALVGLTLALIRPLRPMNRTTAIRIATQHALRVYPGIDLEEYAISAPTRSDWFEEWAVDFHHKSRDAGFLIDVAGGDVYNGSKVRVCIDHEWGRRP